MLSIILQFLLILIIAIPVIYLAWWWTEGRDEFKPSWLDYKPFSCRVCLTFWLLIVIYLAIGFAFALDFTCYGGMAFAFLNFLAMKMDEKNKTVSLDEYDRIK